MSGEFDCLPGEGLKQKLKRFSMNFWPAYNCEKETGVYNWINCENSDVLQISLDKIPSGHSVNMISRASDACFSKFRSGRKMKISIKYTSSLKSNDFKKIPFFTLRASSKDWKNVRNLHSVLLENSNDKKMIKEFSFNGSITPEWVEQLDFQLYAPPCGGSLLIEDVNIVLEEKPDIIFPFGSMISSRHSGKWFQIEKKENMKNSDRIRIVINNEDMTCAKKIETTLAEAGSIRPPEIPGFYFLSVYFQREGAAEDKIVSDKPVYIYE
jgi:hypothetical protein